MKKFNNFFLFLLVAIVGFAILPLSTAEAANYVNATKAVNPSSILVGEETEVTLDITGTPPVNVVRPNDVILIIDRSGSMTPQYNPDREDKMTSAKEAAKGFIDLMDLTKHQVGIVDYSDSTKELPLTSDGSSVKNYINGITANGGTGTGKAILKAKELLANHRPDAQPVIVLMTDGDATIGGDGLSAYDYTLKMANDAKDEGIVFYTIALLGKSENPEASGPNKLLKDMATTSHHHHFVLGSTGLSQIYAAIVKEIGLASAYDVVVTDTIPDTFEIVPDSYNNNIPKPVVSGNTLTWNFLELKNNTLSFNYKIRHKAEAKNGTFPVTQVGSNIKYKDYTGANRTYNLPSQNLVVKYPAPIITTVTPEKGIITGGETVTIQGENFLPNAKVFVANYAASNVVVVSDKEITFTTPVGTQGKVEVKVTNTDNQSATGSFNYYANPEITSLSPNNGPITGGGTVIMTGKYFMKGATVKFGEELSSSVSINNSTSAFVRVPAVTKWGPVDVTIENTDGTSAVLKNGYTYNEPPKLLFTSAAPDKGATTGNENVILTGQEFKTGVKVYFNSVASPSVVFNSSQQLTVKTPAWSQEETVDIKVVNPDGTEAVLTQAFTFVAPPPPPAPTITSISPNSSRMDTSAIVYVDGKDFVSGAKVAFNGTTEVATSFISATRLRVQSPTWSEATTVDVKVTNPDGQSAVKEQGFTFEPKPALPDPTIKV